MEINKIYQGNALTVLKDMPSDFVSCVVTSPPYWSLRAYQTEPQVWDGDIINCQHEWEEKIIKQSGGLKSEVWQDLVDYHRQKDINDKYAFCQKCGAWKGELGLEPTVDLYISHLIQIFDEIKKVLRKDGVIFVNLGDTYSSSPPGNKFNGKHEVGDGLYGRLIDRNKMMGENAKNIVAGRFDKNKYGGKSGIHCGRGRSAEYPSKCLCMIPERFAIEMISHGWLLRNKIAWYKPNAMPSSVIDRFSNKWEYVYMFVKSKKYYFDLDAVREKHTSPVNCSKEVKTKSKAKDIFWYGGQVRENHDIHTCYNPSGKNPGDMWQIPTRGFSEAHFATFPPELCIKPIKAGCPEWICSKCGKARERIVKKELNRNSWGAQKKEIKNYPKDGRCGDSIHETIGWTDCKCGAEFKPGIVMDPFAGAGTTCMVAKKLGRSYIGIELSKEYISMSEKRIEKEVGCLF